MAKFKFIDLFAGIGGFHIAMDNLGRECVFASEWDDDCRKTYTANFSKTSKNIFTDGEPNEYFVGDITKVDPNNGNTIILDLIYYRNEVVKYLMNETKLDSPSSSRYNMLHLYQLPDDENIYFTFNLQIRYKK